MNEVEGGIMRLFHRVSPTSWGAIAIAALIAANGAGSSAQSARPVAGQGGASDAKRCARSTGTRTFGHPSC
jgi:hypothetical protein